MESEFASALTTTSRITFQRFQRLTEQIFRFFQSLQRSVQFTLMLTIGDVDLKKIQAKHSMSRRNNGPLIRASSYIEILFRMFVHTVTQSQQHDVVLPAILQVT